MTAGLFVRAAIAWEQFVGRDPFLDESATEVPNVLDAVDPAWGLGSAHPDYPPRVAARRIRAAAASASSSEILCGPKAGDSA